MLLYCLYETQLPGYLVKYFSFKARYLDSIPDMSDLLKTFSSYAFEATLIKKKEEEENEEEGNFEMVFKVIGPDFDQTFSLLELIRK